MWTVQQVSRLAGVSVRTLHHYHAVGLLPPTAVTGAGYRLYDGRALERLRTILLFRELEFPLKDIRAILESADFDREKALEQQITLLSLKKEHLENEPAAMPGRGRPAGNGRSVSALRFRRGNRF